jgi:hypothetical protein
MKTQRGQRELAKYVQKEYLIRGPEKKSIPVQPERIKEKYFRGL